MQIIHKIDDFLFTIFPELAGGGKSLIINTLEKYYTYGPYKPKVSINNDWVKIEIDTPAILSQEANYKKTVTLCENRKYSEAKPILKNLIKINPTNSEYHRILGQILSDEGDQEEAINCLIDSLRWDSKNGWALLMMGNIFAKFKNDVPTAMKYYDQALIANPHDNITMNNIGANLMQQGKLAEARKYFLEALKVNDKYPNTHFALGMIDEIESDLQSAFSHTIKAIVMNKSKDPLYKNSVKQAFDISKKIIATDTGTKILRNYSHKLEFDGGTDVEIVESNDIPFAAKLEIAENYNRQKHIVRYKPSYPAKEHLIMHELVHLAFIIEARKAGTNQVFISTQKHKADFIKSLEPSIKKFSQKGIPETSIAQYCSSLFNGLNTQVFNAPIDLFIEDFLFKEFTGLRPFQFISQYNMLMEALKAVTEKNIVDLSPKDVLSKSKTYNLLIAMQFRVLYGIDIIDDFNASPFELKQALSFFEEYLQYKDDKEAGEEYELVLHWAQDLKLDKNFELMSESEYRNKADINNILDSIEDDPFDMKSPDPSKDLEMELFLKSQEEIGTNMAVVMYMVDALKFFENKTFEETKKIAFEIAMQGTQGFSPDKNNYYIHSMPGKTFSGYHILAYYYVSWALAIPELLPQLNLPYEKEYKIARDFNRPISN